jgi:hypothetical protein
MWSEVDITCRVNQMLGRPQQYNRVLDRLTWFRIWAHIEPESGSLC